MLDSYQKEYNRLQNSKAELAEESRQTESILCGLLDKLTGFLIKYQLTPDEFNQETIRKIREDVSSIRRLSGEIHALSAEQKQFWEENEKALLMTPRTESDEEDDLTSVKKAEDAAKKALDELNSEITEKEQSLRSLRRIAEELPQKQDESERRKEAMALLRKLSEEHQILYLVCSETRKPKRGIGLTGVVYISLG